MGLIDLSKLTPKTFPRSETEQFEFKSSLLPSSEARREVNHAASAFANSGGGCFIWGIDDETGDPDGGIDPKVGDLDLKAWLDRMVHNVTPSPQYDIRIYEDNQGRGILNAGKILAAVSIHPSSIGPHMADDNKYYIRAGRHTDPATHSLVEALWARRQIQTPMLTMLLNVTDNSGTRYVFLKVVNMTTAPAIEVELDMSPREFVPEFTKFLPVRVPLIDKENPFSMFVNVIYVIRQTLHTGVKITLKFKDIVGNEYSVETDAAQLIEGISPSDQGDILAEARLKT